MTIAVNGEKLPIFRSTEINCMSVHSSIHCHTSHTCIKMISEMDKKCSLLQLMLSTEENHESPQDIVVPVEEGDFSVTSNSQLSRRSKTSRRKTARRDKYIHASNQPSIKVKLDKTDKTKLTDADAEIHDDNKKEEAAVGDSIEKNDVGSCDSGKIDQTNKAEVQREIVKEEEKTNDDVDLDQTDRLISGRSEDSETEKSQDNLSMTARTENDVSEIPENEVEDTQNPEENGYAIDKSKHESKKSQQIEYSHYKNLGDQNDSIEEEIAEEIERSSDGNNMDKKAGVNNAEKKIDHDVFGESVKTGSIKNRSKAKENIKKGSDDQELMDENLSEAEKIQMCEAVLGNYIKAAQAEISSNEVSDEEIQEEIQYESIQTEIFDEVLDDYIGGQERNIEHSEGDETVVIHRILYDFTLHAGYGSQK